MPGVTDWQQGEVTWEQGPIGALVSINITEKTFTLAKVPLSSLNSVCRYSSFKNDPCIE